LEGTFNEVVNQEFTEYEALAQKQVKEAQAKIEAFEAELQSDLG
jgi:hypothetical protein